MEGSGSRTGAVSETGAGSGSEQTNYGSGYRRPKNILIRIRYTDLPHPDAHGTHFNWCIANNLSQKILIYGPKYWNWWHLWLRTGIADCPTLCKSWHRTGIQIWICINNGKSRIRIKTMAIHRSLTWKRKIYRETEPLVPDAGRQVGRTQLHRVLHPLEPARGAQVLLPCPVPQDGLEGIYFNSCSQCSVPVFIV